MKRGKGSDSPRWTGRRARETNPRSRLVAAPSARRGVNSQKTDKGLRERARARRKGTIRRAWDAFRILSLVAAVACGLGAAGWSGYRAFQNNGFLDLRQVDVIGNSLVAKAEILEKAGLELGIKLPSVPVKNVEAALKDIPGLGDVEVRRIFPSRIEIRVLEKEPVAMGYAKGWHGLAPDGSRIAGLDWAVSDLPVVDGFSALDSSARAALGAFLDGAKRSRPALYQNFSQLAMRGRDEVEIILRDGRLKVLLELPERDGIRRPPEKATNPESNKSLNSLEFLQALIRQQGASLQPGKTVDLRVEGFAYVR